MAKRSTKSLVVVESPAKARTISRILGSKYDVKASIGHVRDLPTDDIAVSAPDFRPTYCYPNVAKALWNGFSVLFRQPTRFYSPRIRTGKGRASAGT